MSGRLSKFSPKPAAAAPNRADIEEKLRILLQEYPEYTFVNQNGQRIFQLQESWNCPLKPPRGCEIFIGNIPKHLFENELIPLFATIGKLFNFRIMLDFSLRNRGYAFAKYFNPEDAQSAITAFNNFSMHRNVKLAVYLSIDNCRLFVGNIPKDKSPEEVLTLFKRNTDHVVKIIMYKGWEPNALNRGFAFIEFENHLAASLARRHLHPKNLVAWDHTLYVDWADPLPAIDPKVLAKVTTLYITQLPLSLNHAQIKQIFLSVVGTGIITRLHKINTFAFLHCTDRSSAEIAMQRLNGFKLTEDNIIGVEWSIPPHLHSKHSDGAPNNYCLSVPLRSRKLLQQRRESSSCSNGSNN